MCVGRLSSYVFFDIHKRLRVELYIVSFILPLSSVLRPTASEVPSTRQVQTIYDAHLFREFSVTVTKKNNAPAALFPISRIFTPAQWFRVLRVFLLRT